MVRFDVGDGTALPYEDGEFDRSLSMLRLDVVPDAAPIVAEMRRVTRPGGVVAGLVNDFRCGYPAFTMLWDTAAVLDPGFAELREHLTGKRIGSTSATSASGRQWVNSAWRACQFKLFTWSVKTTAATARPLRIATSKG